MARIIGANASERLNNDALGANASERLNSRLIITLLVALLTVCGAEARKPKKLVILHTNDTHSCVMPLSKNLADTTIAGRGGFLRRAAMIKEQRSQAPGLLLIDSGDFSQGSSYYTMFKGDVEVGLMNEMGYDAATIGNHEFDFGLENMERIFRKCNFPIVCSNYDFADTGLNDVVKRYVVLRRQGLRIGLFALCPQLDGLVFEKNYGPLRYLDPATVAQEMVTLLRGKEKCDVVICISHLGWNTIDYSDDNLLPDTEGIDLVLGGHSHSYFQKLEYVTDKAGRKVPVDQNGKHGAFVSRIELTFE